MATANPALSCKKIYPTFIRTVPPEHYQNMGRVGLIQHFGWSKVAIVQQSLDTYLGLSNDLIKRLKKADIHIITHEIFKDNEATLAIENVKVRLTYLFTMHSLQEHCSCTRCWTPIYNTYMHKAKVAFSFSLLCSCFLFPGATLRLFFIAYLLILLDAHL